MNAPYFLDYSGKTTEWIQHIKKLYSDMVAQPVHAPIFDRIMDSANEELRKRGIEK